MPKQTRKSKPPKKTKRPAFAIDAALVETFVKMLATEPFHTLVEWQLAHAPHSSAEEEAAFIGEVWRACKSEELQRRFCALAEFTVGPYREYTRYEGRLCRAMKTEDPIEKMAKIFVEMEKKKLLPEDWQTREGDLICVLRWYVATFAIFHASVQARDAGERAIQGGLLKEACAAVEICMDRVLTLSQPQHAGLCQEVEDLRRHLKMRRAEVCGE